METVRTGEGLTGELRQFQLQIEEVRAQLKAITVRFSPAQCAWRPTEGSWSVAECLDHLVLFGQQVEEAATSMIQEAKAKGRMGGPYRHSLLGKLLIRSVEPPYRLRFPAVQRLRPAAEVDGETVIQGFRAHLDRLERLLDEAQGLDLAAVKRPVPPTNLNLTLGQWLALCLAHQRRHLWQAGRIQSHPDFPLGQD